ncbi:MAG: hypothetical protein ACTSR0_03895 [Candidatus Asgardarchaeia archaeon]
MALTNWLDSALGVFARQAGIPVEEYSAYVGGEAIGNGLEIITDIFTKGWFNKTVQFLTGLIGTTYAIYGKGVSPRLRKELLAIGTHELLRIFDPKPSDLIELRNSIDQLVAGIKNKDWNAILNSMLRSPAEIQAYFVSLGIPAPKAKPTELPPAPKAVKKAVYPEFTE